jgi:2-keto-4-pentenoate hydratase/2-oxohepta-3-ene-1,7-dioic acid hydratase in catechol pathway
MKLISFEADGRRSYGAVTDGGIVDLGARLGLEAPALIDLIAGDLVTRAKTIAAGAAADCALESVRLERPVPAPSKILCVGINYLDRNAEYKDGTEQPKNPACSCASPPRSWRMGKR